MRNLGLDLLRAIAVLLVIGRHMRPPPNPSPLMAAWHTGGWVGVDLFFVLSGFLVSSLLFREYSRNGCVDVKRFLVRRAFKIYPAFWLFLIFTVCMRSYWGNLPSLLTVLGEVLFIQNYTGGLWQHTWSLAVEEHFYFGLAALVTWMLFAHGERPFRHIPQVFAVVAVGCLSLRLMNLIVFPEFTERAYLYGTHIRIDSLMFGVLLSYGWNLGKLEDRMKPIPSWLLLACGSLLLLPAFLFEIDAHRWMAIVGVIGFYVGSGMFVLAAMRMPPTELLPLKWLAAIGAASYSIYLWHIPIGTWGYGLLCRLTGWDNMYLYLFNAVVGACFGGWLLNRLIENPVLMLRDRVFPSTTRAIEPATWAAHETGGESLSASSSETRAASPLPGSLSNS